LRAILFYQSFTMSPLLRGAITLCIITMVSVSDSAEVSDARQGFKDALNAIHATVAHSDDQGASGQIAGPEVATPAQLRRNKISGLVRRALGDKHAKDQKRKARWERIRSKLRSPLKNYNARATAKQKFAEVLKTVQATAILGRSTTEEGVRAPKSPTGSKKKARWARIQSMLGNALKKGDAVASKMKMASNQTGDEPEAKNNRGSKLSTLRFGAGHMHSLS
jgi:hypothetical protein